MFKKKKEKKKEKEKDGEDDKTKGGAEDTGKKMKKEERVQLLQSILRKPENQECADCGASPVTSLSTTLGCLLCANCAKVHHETLPENVSIIVSITAEALNERNAWLNHPIAPDILIYLSFTGNQNANSYWEAKLRNAANKSQRQTIANPNASWTKEKYEQGEYAKDVTYVCKTGPEKKKKSMKKKYFQINEVGKIIYIFGQDPNTNPDVQHETSIYLLESTLQFDNVGDTPIFKINYKGCEYIFDLLTRKAMFDAMFEIHRAWMNVMEQSAFHLGKWLDRIGFSQAVSSNDLDRIREYCNEEEKYAMMRDNRNWTPLHTACNDGKIELAILLLDYKVDVEFRNTSGATPLHYFFGRKHTDDMEGAMKLLEKVQRKNPNMDWKAANNGGTTYLAFAVQVSSTELAKWLVEHGADPDSANDRGFTPLLTAVFQNQVDMVSYFLDKKADIFIKTKQGKSALQLAKDRNHEEMYEMLFEIWEDRRIKNQNNVIGEILSTETDFNKHLDILTEVYRDGLRSEVKISDKAVKAIFSNVVEIREAAKKFLEAILPVKDMSPEKKNVGSRFLEHQNYFRLYIPYCKNQTIAMKSLQIALAHPKIADFMKRQETKHKDRLRGEKIDGYLIKPLQRITRFPLLLRELQKYTPETHEDFQSLKEISQLLGDIVAQANEAKRARDHKDEVLESFSTQGVQWSLTSRLVSEGMCAVLGLDSKLESTFWFLFNDLFVLAKPSKGDVKYKIENAIVLATLPLLWEVKGKEASKLASHAFSIVLPDRANTKITLCFKSKEEKQNVMDLLSEYISEFMSENERKALMMSKSKGLTMKGGGSGSTIQVNVDKDRPIFVVELFDDPKATEGTNLVGEAKNRETISLDPKLLRRIGAIKDDNVFRSLTGAQKGSGLDRKGLFKAIRDKENNVVKNFLEQNVEYCHLRDKKDVTPFHVACQVGNLEALSMLLDKGGDPGAKDKRGMTPFHEFFRCKFQNPREAEKLLDSLHGAIEEGFIDFGTTDNNGESCLFACVDGEGEAQLITWLLTKGNVDPNVQNKKGETPLLRAIRSKLYQATNKLMSSGADVWIKSNDNDCPVIAAHECGDDKIWQLVLRRLNNPGWKRPPPPKQNIRATKHHSTAKGFNKFFNTPSSFSSSGSGSGGKSEAKESRTESPAKKKWGHSSSLRESPKRNSQTASGTRTMTMTTAAEDSASKRGSVNLAREDDPAVQKEIAAFKESNKVHTYHQIKANRDKLDLTKLESYMSDKQFLEVMGMDKKAFYALPAWKRTMVKKDVDLF